MHAQSAKNIARGALSTVLEELDFEPELPDVPEVVPAL